MTIGIDIRVLSDVRYSGVAEYAKNLLQALLAEDKVNNYILFYNSAKSEIGYCPTFNAPNVSVVYRRWPNKLLNYGIFKLANQPLDKFLGCRFDVFWAPHLNFLVWPQGRKILTVHDLSFLRYPEFFSWRQNLWHGFLGVRRLIEQADCLMAISENTKRDIINLIGLPSEKISVVYSGVSSDFRLIIDNVLLSSVRQKYQLPERFILYLGTLEPRKNLPALFEAYDYLRDCQPALSAVKLVIAGADGWKYKQIYRRAAASPFATDIKFLGYVSADDKPALYNLAEVFAFPSFYEGFGFPPLEAMAAGTPVVTSFASAISEVVGGAGLLIDPYNSVDLGEALCQVLTDKNLAVDLSCRGLEQAQKFTWQKTARTYLKLFTQ